MKRVWISLFCIAMVLALAACKKPFGQTPYESIGGENTSIVTDDDEAATDDTVTPDEPSTDASTQEPLEDNGGAEQNGTTSADSVPTQSAGSENTDENSGTADEQPNASDDATVSDDPQTEDDNPTVNGTTTKGNGVATTRRDPVTTAKKGQTTAKKGQTTKKNTATTTASNGSVGGADNEVELDWGDLVGTTTKAANGTTAKPTTAAPTTQPATTAKPGVRSFPKEGDKVHEKLELGKVEIDGNSGTMIVKNISAGNETEQTSYLLFSCYDKNGKSLGDVRVNIGRIHAKQQTAPLKFTVPESTVTMTFKEFVGEFWTDGFH